MFRLANFRIEIDAPRSAIGGSTPPDCRRDALRHVNDVRVVAEFERRQFKAAAALDVDLVRSVHKNIGDAFVREQGLNWPDAEHVVENLVDNERLLGQRQRQTLAGGRLGCDLLDARAYLAARHHERRRHVHRRKDGRTNCPERVGADQRFIAIRG
jgi:hypothetical protein